MKKFLTLIWMSSLVVGLSANSASASVAIPVAQLAYDQYNEAGIFRHLEKYPNVKNFKAVYPTVLTKGNSPTPPFYGVRYFRYPCDEVVLSSKVKITQSNQVIIQTYGYSPTKSQAKTCSILYKGKYKNLYTKGHGYIFREGKIFMFKKNQIAVTGLFIDEEK